MIKATLADLIGNLPSENRFKHRARFHQSWWRACVLAEEAGKWPGADDRTIGNTIAHGEESRNNFLTAGVSGAVEETRQERKQASAGMMDEDRLFNNLLSSQPLCFNFFGELKADTDFALRVLRTLFPALTEVVRVTFECAPAEKYIRDNSAFDVAFEVRSGDRTGLIGWECKYTDPFSTTPYDRPEYRQVFARSSVFARDYQSYVAPRFNQLFRSQLLAEALVQNQRHDFVTTGLFCHHADEHALEVGRDFQAMLHNGEEHFGLVTYQRFIERVQQLSLTWDQREWTMLLWARYCATRLSDAAH